MVANSDGGCFAAFWFVGDFRFSIWPGTIYLYTVLNYLLADFVPTIVKEELAANNSALE